MEWSNEIMGAQEMITTLLVIFIISTIVIIRKESRHDDRP